MYKVYTDHNAHRLLTSNGYDGVVKKKKKKKENIFFNGNDEQFGLFKVRHLRKEPLFHQEKALNWRPNI